MAERGFQLIESLMVCLLLGTALAGGITALNGVTCQYRLYSAGNLFASEISALRSDAISRNSPLSIQVGPSTTEYGSAPRGTAPYLWKRLPTGVYFAFQPRTPVTFYSRGNAVPAGAYVLQNPAGRLKVVVSPTGRVRWEYVE